jgi:hypothetical protein
MKFSAKDYAGKYSVLFFDYLSAGKLSAAPPGDVIHFVRDPLQFEGISPP